MADDSALIEATAARFALMDPADYQAGIGTLSDEHVRRYREADPSASEANARASFEAFMSKVRARYWQMMAHGSGRA